MSDIPPPLSHQEREPESKSEMLEEMAEEGFSLSDQRIADIQDALYEEDGARLRALFEDLSESDMADLFHKIDREDRHNNFFEHYKDIIAPEVYAYLDYELRESKFFRTCSRCRWRDVSELILTTRSTWIEDL